MQIGQLDPARLPVTGAEAARKLRDPGAPGNGLMAEAWASSAGKPLRAA